MAELKACTWVDAPPEAVFAAFSDVRTATERVRAITAIEMLTEGPVGRGTRFRETRTMFGRPCTETMEFTGWEPPRSYTLCAASCGARYATTFTFTPERGGTAVEMKFSATPVTFFAKLMSPISRLMISACRKMVEGDLADLKAAAEGRPAPAPLGA